MKPEAKLHFVENLQKSGRRVMMLGDGLNDAGALKQADVGVAVSENTMQFSPAADAILAAGSLAELPAYLRFSRWCLRVIQVSFGVSVLYNLAGLSYAMRGGLSPLVAAVLMPLSSATMLALATAGTALAARVAFRGFQQSSKN